MDIKKLRGILNLPIPDDRMEEYIISFIAEDKDVIPNILKILNAERAEKSELILDMNLQLSRALVVLKDENLKYNKKKITVDPSFVISEIFIHYKKWKNYINCNFKIKELNEFLSI